MGLGLVLYVVDKNNIDDIGSSKDAAHKYILNPDHLINLGTCETLFYFAEGEGCKYKKILDENYYIQNIYYEDELESLVNEGFYGDRFTYIDCNMLKLIPESVIDKESKFNRKAIKLLSHLENHIAILVFT